MRRLAARVAGARYVSVPGAAHIANLQNEAEFNRALLAFLNS
jgi:3-oxoadipate enol-lactonase